MKVFSPLSSWISIWRRGDRLARTQEMLFFWLAQTLKNILFWKLKSKWFGNIAFAHFRLWFWHYTVYRSYFPLKRAKWSHFMQGSMKITYLFPHNLFKNLMLEQLVNFLFAIKLSSDYLQGSNIYNLWENYTQLCCPVHCSY